MAYLLQLLDDLTPQHVYDQDFGLGLHPSELAPLLRSELLGQQNHYMRPWRHQHGSNSGVSNVVSNSDEFKVNLDVKQFKPEEISVKTVDNFIEIEGRHEERRDEHGFISRQFKRRYRIPEDVDPNTVQSQLSSDGVLSISGPKKQKLSPMNERVVPITQTNKPAIKGPAKKNKQEKMEQ